MSRSAISSSSSHRNAAPTDIPLSPQTIRSATRIRQRPGLTSSPGGSSWTQEEVEGLTTLTPGIGYVLSIIDSDEDWNLLTLRNDLEGASSSSADCVKYGRAAHWAALMDSSHIRAGTQIRKGETAGPKVPEVITQRHVHSMKAEIVENDILDDAPPVVQFGGIRKAHLRAPLGEHLCLACLSEQTRILLGGRENGLRTSLAQVLDDWEHRVSLVSTRTYHKSIQPDLRLRNGGSVSLPLEDSGVGAFKDCAAKQSASHEDENVWEMDVRSLAAIDLYSRR
ncbi:hypothetical protein EIP91_002130 [Steccherinum ochraceum]|uniref:Uncharacterized protein n=1 Tax=Steccherinum ochraceum TaxID=92696 RepID=A0A4R0RPY3_9APHY|nr:hypothetical protein EIP91_002130 [Steccherinum ochraceum]